MQGARAPFHHWTPPPRFGGAIFATLVRLSWFAPEGLVSAGPSDVRFQELCELNGSRIPARSGRPAKVGAGRSIVLRIGAGAAAGFRRRLPLLG